MSLKEWIDHMLGRAQQRHDEVTREMLDTIEAQQVDTLAAITGKTPEEIRDDARKRVLSLETQSVRHRR